MKLFPKREILFVAVIFVAENFATIVYRHNAFTALSGLKNNGGVLRHLTVVSKFDCSAHCIRTSGCNSFNTGPTSDDGRSREVACELVTTDQNSLTTIVEQPGWTLFVGR